MTALALAVVPMHERGQAARNFVVNSWLRSYEQRAMLDGLDRREYYRDYHRTVTALLDHETTLLATLAAEPDMFVAWACGGLGRIHYVFVKRGIWRRQGTAAMLLERVAGPGPGVYTFRSLRGAVNDAMDAAGWRYDETQRRTHGRREQEQGANAGAGAGDVPQGGGGAGRAPADLDVVGDAAPGQGGDASPARDG